MSCCADYQIVCFSVSSFFQGGKDAVLMAKPRMAKSVASSSLRSNIDKENPVEPVFTKKQDPEVQVSVTGW